MHLVVQVGSGIGRIQELMRGVNLPEPVFQKEGVFTVMLKRHTSNSARSREKSREKIIRLLQENPYLTTIELGETIGITVKGIEKQIFNLKKEGIIERIGPDKGGFWKIIKQ